METRRLPPGFPLLDEARLRARQLLSFGSISAAGPCIVCGFDRSFRRISGQNSFKILAVISTPSCMPSFAVASAAARLFA
jgi:hypothetical protein